MTFTQTDIDYALFSANVYGNKNEYTTSGSDIVRSTQNTLPVPDGWNVLSSKVKADGFMAKAYRPEDQNVAG